MKKIIDGITLEMSQVESRIIAYAGYDEEKKSLMLEFCRGSAYLYTGVPNSVFEALMSAEAIDDYFNENIRNSFENRRVN